MDIGTYSLCSTLFWLAFVVEWQGQKNLYFCLGVFLLSTFECYERKNKEELNELLIKKAVLNFYSFHVFR